MPWRLCGRTLRSDRVSEIQRYKGTSQQQGAFWKALSLLKNPKAKLPVVGGAGTLMWMVNRMPSLAFVLPMLQALLSPSRLQESGQQLWESFAKEGQSCPVAGSFVSQVDHWGPKVFFLAGCF